MVLCGRDGIELERAKEMLAKAGANPRVEPSGNGIFLYLVNEQRMYRGLDEIAAYLREYSAIPHESNRAVL